MVKVKEDLTGRRFGRLVVLEQAEDYVSLQGKRHARWRCRCDCGNETLVKGSGLKRGSSQSCGCLNRERSSQKSKQLKHGVGVMDGEVGEGSMDNPIYATWSAMLNRCYGASSHIHKPSYQNCVVCTEWHTYSIFKQWYLQNLWCAGDAQVHLDKDFLFKGNHLYSPETCILMPRKINIILPKSDANRGKYPVGTSWDKGSSKYKAQISIDRKKVHLGLYNTVEEAFQAYKQAKEQYIKQVADEYKAKYPDFPQKLYDAMYAYEVEITD